MVAQVLNSCKYIFVYMVREFESQLFFIFSAQPETKSGVVADKQGLVCGFNR